MKKTLLGVVLLFNIIGQIYSTQCKFNEYYEIDDSSEHGVTETKFKTNCTCGSSNKKTTKIVGGVRTLPNEYPLMAGLVYWYKEIKCGGAIITQRHVVTAAHCLGPYKVNNITIHVGHYSYEEVKNTTKLYESERFIIHPQYDVRQVTYDIGIILLKLPIEFNALVGPVCLPKNNFVPSAGKFVKALGWGRIGYKMEPSKYLLKVNLKVTGLYACIDPNPKFEIFDVHQLCMKLYSYKDTCEGDSGGPMIWLDPQTNRYTLLGLVSYGYGCAHRPAVASDINYFLPWIQSTIASTDSTYQTCSKI